MNRKKIIAFLYFYLIFFSFFMVFIPVTTAATTRYISTTGNDSTGDGTIGNPYKTLSKAVNVSGLSDTLIMRGGSYTPGSNTRIHSKSGIAGAYYTIRNYTGETVIINGDNVPMSNYSCSILEFYDCQYIRVTGIRFNHSKLMGISIQINCDYIRFENCTIENCSGAAYKSVSNTGSNTNTYLFLDDCYIYNNFNNWSSIPGAICSQETISFSRTNHFRIHGNSIIGNHCENIDCKAGANNGTIDNNFINTSATKTTFKGGKYFSGGVGIYIDGYTDNACNFTVSNNTIVGNNTCIEIAAEHPESGGTARDIVVENNLIYQNGKYTASWTNGGGISLGQHAVPTHIYRVTVRGNTVITPATNNPYYPIYARAFKEYYHDCKIENNIFIDMNGSVNYHYVACFDHWNLTDDLSGKIDLDYNCYYRFPGAYSAIRISWMAGASTSGGGTHSIKVNPLFVNRNTYDFHLNATSPCIGIANASIVSVTDKDGRPRPQNGTSDIGAFEYYTATAPAVSNPYPPSDGAGYSTPIISLNITIADRNNERMNLYFRSNYTGSWATLGSNLSVLNGTYRCMSPGFVGLTKYWWSVNCSDPYPLWINRTYNFSTIASTAVYAPSSIHANWTTSTSINLTWVKTGSTSHTAILRKIGSYPSGVADPLATTVYDDTGTYFNDTGKVPSIRYYYRIWGSGVGGYSNESVNVSLAETENTTTTTSSSISFNGWIGTDTDVTANFHYASNPEFTSTLVNETLFTAYYNGTAPYGHTAKIETADTKDAGQTFTTGTEAYYVYKVAVKVYRVGSPGTLFCQIWSANTSSGFPSGVILAQDSVSGTSITTSTSGQWVNFTLSNYKLLTNTRYAILLQCYGTAANYINLLGDNSAPLYSGGCLFEDYPYGYGYQNVTGYDSLFKIYGHFPDDFGSYLITSNATVTTSGAITITQNDLTPGQMYWYYETANDTNGNITRGNVRYSLTNPERPVFMNIDPDFSNNSVNISWVKGNGANRTIIIYKNDEFPTTIYDGTVIYNGTGSYFWATNISFNATYKFSLFGLTIWGTMNRYSAPAIVPWGGMSFNCYNESSGLPIKYSVLISDYTGQNVYYGPALNGWTFINVSEIPHGEHTIFYVTNASGKYNARTYDFNIQSNTFYNFSFYLPVTIIPPADNESLIYRILVKNRYDVYLNDVKVECYRYLPGEDSFELMSAVYTASGGAADFYLITNSFYLFKLNKTGFQNSTFFWTPTSDVRTYEAVMDYATTDEEQTIDPYDVISFTAGFPTNNITLEVDVDDSTGNLTDATIYIYENGSLIYTMNFSSTPYSFNYTHNATSPNNNLSEYVVVLCIRNHSDFPADVFNMTIIIHRSHRTGLLLNVDIILEENLGNPGSAVGVVIGWVNIFLMAIGIFIVVSFGRYWSGLGLIALGFFIGLVEFVYGLPGFTTVQIITFVAYCVIMGALVEINKAKQGRLG